MTIAHTTELPDVDSADLPTGERSDGEPVLDRAMPGHSPAAPTNAIVGRLASGRRLVDTVSFLASHGIEASRIHVLRGPEGEVFLARVGNRFSRWFADDLAEYEELLRNGSTLVAVMDVDTPDLDRTGALMRHAGVRVLRRYGAWTYDG